MNKNVWKSRAYIIMLIQHTYQVSKFWKFLHGYQNIVHDTVHEHDKQKLDFFFGHVILPMLKLSFLLDGSLAIFNEYCKVVSLNEVFSTSKLGQSYTSDKCI